MTHRESPCHPKIVILAVPTQTKAVMRVSRGPVFESVTEDREPVKDGAHETLTIRLIAYAPWSVSQLR
jgi:hypothetical protein